MDRINIQGVNGVAARPSARGAAPVSRIDRARPVASQGEPPATAVNSATGHAGRKPPVDEERVNQLREAIGQGRYPLDPHKTAEAMIASGIISRTEG
jgi:negative regulator of flagellin synthesis FlgM